MIFEIPIYVIDSATGDSVPVMAIIDTITRETLHRPSHHCADSVLVEEEPDG